MTVEDFIIARPHLEELGEEGIDLLLDLIENPRVSVNRETLSKLLTFLRRLEVDFGEDHESVRQVRKAVSVQLHATRSTLFRSADMRLS